MVRRKSASNPDYSRDREFTVVLEDLRSQFRVFGEGLGHLNGRVDQLVEDVTQLKEDVRLLKEDMSLLKEDVSLLKTEMHFVRTALPTLATKDDLLVFEKRFVRLETAR